MAKVQGTTESQWSSRDRSCHNGKGGFKTPSDSAFHLLINSRALVPLLLPLSSQLTMNRSTRIILLLSIDVLFFFVELIVGE